MSAFTLLPVEMGSPKYTLMLKGSVTRTISVIRKLFIKVWVMQLAA